MDMAALTVGSALPPVVTPPISRYTLAMFAGGSGDHNPMHVDIDFAKSFGMPDVFAHGMLSMAYLAQVLTRNFDQLATNLQAPDGPIARLNTTVDRVGGSLEAVTSDLELQTLPHLVAMTDEARTSLRAVRRTATSLTDRPQSILFGAPDGEPGPGEPGFSAPTK